jgi:hypothetical protein
MNASNKMNLTNKTSDCTRLGLLSGVLTKRRPLPDA